MNDRYLYKAKRIDTGEWVEGYLLHPHCTDSEKGVESYYFKERDENGWYSQRIVEASTICQCTGLKDKNGKLIWENDIVAYWDTYSTESGYSEADCIGKVFWDGETMSFQVTGRLSAESYEVLDECSVIGNIFDNPELLEVD